MTWQPVDSIGVSESSVSVSVADLKPRAQYQFRVIAVNSRGISYPSLPSLNVLPQGLALTLHLTYPELNRFAGNKNRLAYCVMLSCTVASAAEGEEKPYYEQWWFIVMVALTCVTVIILLVSTCIAAVRHKNKYSKSNGALSMLQSIYSIAMFLLTIEFVISIAKTLCIIGIRHISLRPPMPLPAIPQSATMNTIGKLSGFALLEVLSVWVHRFNTKVFLCSCDSVHGFTAEKHADSLVPVQTQLSTDQYAC